MKSHNPLESQAANESVSGLIWQLAPHHQAT